MVQGFIYQKNGLVNPQCDRLWEPMGPFWAVSLILVCLGMFLGRQVTISGKSELLIDGATGSKETPTGQDINRFDTRSYILLELSALAIANSVILFALNFLPPAWFSRTMAKRIPLKQPIHLPKMTSPPSDDLWRHKTSLGWEAPVPSNSNGL